MIHYTATVPETASVTEIRSALNSEEGLSLKDVNQARERKVWLVNFKTVGPRPFSVFFNTLIKHKVIVKINEAFHFVNKTKREKNMNTLL